MTTLLENYINEIQQITVMSELKDRVHASIAAEENIPHATQISTTRTLYAKKRLRWFVPAAAALMLVAGGACAVW